MFLSSRTSKIGSGRSYLYVGRWSRGRLTHQKAGICHFCDLLGGVLIIIPDQNHLQEHQNHLQDHKHYLQHHQHHLQDNQDDLQDNQRRNLNGASGRPHPFRYRRSRRRSEQGPGCGEVEAPSRWALGGRRYPGPESRFADGGLWSSISEDWASGGCRGGMRLSRRPPPCFKGGDREIFLRPWGLWEEVSS